MQTGFDEMLERRFGADPPARSPARTTKSCPRSRSSELRRSRPRSRAAIRCRWRSAGRCARRAMPIRRRDAGVRDGRDARPDCRRRPRPRAAGADRAGEEGSHPRDRRAAGAGRRPISTTSKPPGRWRREMRQANVTDPAKVRAVNERIVAIDPFDGEAHVVLGRLAMQRNDPEAATRDFKAVLALNPVDPRRGPHRSRRELLQVGQDGRRQEADAGGARDRADLRPRAGAVAEAGGERAVTRRGAPASAVRRPRHRSPCWSCCPMAPGRRWRQVRPIRCGRSSAQTVRRRRRSLRRPAVAIRPHQVSLRRPKGREIVRRTSPASRGSSTARRPSRTCRAA